MSRYLEAVRKAADLQSALNEVGDNNDRSRLLEELSWAYYTHTHTQVEIQIFRCQLALQNASLMSEEALS